MIKIAQEQPSAGIYSGERTIDGLVVMYKGAPLTKLLALDDDLSILESFRRADDVLERYPGDPAGGQRREVVGIPSGRREHVCLLLREDAFGRA